MLAKTVLVAALLLAAVPAFAPSAQAAPDCLGYETEWSCTGIDRECIGHHAYAFVEYCAGVRRSWIPPVLS